MLRAIPPILPPFGGLPAGSRYGRKGGKVTIYNEFAAALAALFGVPMMPPIPPVAAQRRRSPKRVRRKA